MTDRTVESVQSTSDSGTPADRAVAPQSTNRIEARAFVWAMVALVTLGLLLRVNYIQGHFLWNDEAMTRYLTNLSWSEFLARFTSGRDFHPPLYFVWLRTAKLLSGGLLDTQTLRYADLVWLPATVGVLTWVGVRRPSYRIATAVAGVALAVGPTFVYLGAELRSYGLLTFLAVLLAVLAARQLEDVNRPAIYVALTATTALLLSLTHYVGILIVAAILGSASLIALLFGRRPLRFVASGLIAAVAFLPYSPVLLMQLRNQTTIYSTPASEALDFLEWGMVPVGAMMVVLSVVGFTVALARRGGLSRHSELTLQDRSIAVPSLMLILSAALFVLGAGAVAVVRDVDLLNFGASLTPSILLTLGAALISAHFMPRTTMVVALIAGAFAITIAVGTNRDPSVFEDNRISTVDALVNAVAIDSSLGQYFGADVTIIHIGWNISNDYFAEKAALILPGADIQLLPIPRWQELDQVLSETMTRSPTDRILVITRLPIETRVLTEVPLGSSAKVVGRIIVEIEPTN